MHCRRAIAQTACNTWKYQYRNSSLLLFVVKKITFNFRRCGYRQLTTKSAHVGILCPLAVHVSRLHARPLYQTTCTRPHVVTQPISSLIDSYNPHNTEVNSIIVTLEALGSVLHFWGNHDAHPVHILSVAMSALSGCHGSFRISAIIMYM